VTDIVVRRQPARDAYGDPAADDPVTHTIVGCAIEPAGPSPITDRGRDGSVVVLTVYLPAGADLRHDDLVEYDGQLYTVDGEPSSWQSPLTGWAPGATAQIRRAVG
jgi:hypothetical protein